MKKMVLGLTMLALLGLGLPMPKAHCRKGRGTAAVLGGVFGLFTGLALANAGKRKPKRQPRRRIFIKRKVRTVDVYSQDKQIRQAKLQARKARQEARKLRKQRARERMFRLERKMDKRKQQQHSNFMWLLLISLIIALSLAV